MKKGLIIRLIICGILATTGYIIGHYDFNIMYSHWIAIGSYVLACLIIGYPVVISAFDRLMHFDIFDENIIMIVTVIGIVYFNKLSIGLFVLFVFVVGKGLQEYCIKVAEDNLKSNIVAKTEKVIVKSEDRTNYTAPELIEPGETIVIKPGERVPFDCRIIQGESSISSSEITGDPEIIKVKENDVLLSGCTNLEGTIECAVLKNYEKSFDCQLDRIIKNVEDENDKNTIRQSVEKFTRVYSFIICLLAVVLVFLPPIIFKQTHRKWILRGLSFLVIACPGGMLVTIPLAVIVCITTCIRNGIVIKNSKMVDTLRRVKHVVFTKTGIITEGNYEVINVVPKDISSEELIRIVAHAELFAKHSIAKPLQSLYKGKYDESKIKGFQEIPSKGVKANIFLSDTIVGNERLLRENNIPFKNIREQGTLIHVAVSGEYKGFIILSDKIKGSITQQIESLREAKIKELYVMSGDDSSQVVEAARIAGIGECYSELTMPEKVKTLEEIKSRVKKNQKVAFAGNYKTDEELFMKSDVGIALEQFDNVEDARMVSIISDDVSKIEKAIHFSKRTITIVKENVYLIIMIKMALLVLAGLGYLNVWQIALADLGASFIAILHTMRIIK